MSFLVSPGDMICRTVNFAKEQNYASFPEGEPTVNSRLEKQEFGIGNRGCLPFTKKFRKFRLVCKWNTTFWFVPLENFREQWDV